MNMIKLSQYEENSDEHSVIYVNSEYIVGIEPEFNRYGEFIHTHVNFVNGGYYTVTETPEEILDLINNPWEDY